MLLQELSSQGFLLTTHEVNLLNVSLVKDREVFYV